MSKLSNRILKIVRLTSLYLVLHVLFFLTMCQSFETKSISNRTGTPAKRNCKLQISEAMHWNAREIVYESFDTFEIYPETKGNTSPQYIVAFEQFRKNQRIDGFALLSVITLYIIPYWQNSIRDFRIRIMEPESNSSVAAEHIVYYDEVFWLFTLPWAFHNDARLSTQLTKVLEIHCAKNQKNTIDSTLSP